MSTYKTRKAQAKKAGAGVNSESAQERALNLFADMMIEKIESIMTDFAVRFQAASIQELVEFFNQSVNNHGWTSMRAVHDQMLIHEFIRRGIDVSAIHDGNTTDFSHTVTYDKEHNKLVIAGGK